MAAAIPTHENPYMIATDSLSGLYRKHRKAWMNNEVVPNKWRYIPDTPHKGSGRRSDGTRSWALGSHCRELYGFVSAVSFYTEGRCAACICAVAGRSGQPRLAQTAGSPSGWRTSMLAKLSFDPARGVAASVASAWSGGGCGAGVALWMPWLRQRPASGEGSVGGIAGD